MKTPLEDGGELSRLTEKTGRNTLKDISPGFDYCAILNFLFFP